MRGFITPPSRVQRCVNKLAVIVFLLLICACSKGERASVTSDAPSQTEAAGSRGVVSVDAKAASAPAASAAPRMIVRSAEMRVLVGDTTKAVTEATRSAEAMGGYVSASQVWREGELLRARLTLRVPADKLTPALARLRALSKRVEHESITSEDVSAEFIDLGARLRNLEATEEELRQLLVVARQNTRRASDVLEVHQQLSNIRGEIEQVKGRMRYLSETAAMSSIALDITPDALAQPVVEPGWQPLVVAKDAIRALIAMMQSLASAAIWIVIYVLPLLAMFALFVMVARRVWRRFGGARPVE
ncbi:MAG TPA: DUF4349 domain-containing protein [Thermoanaerobaculia bacterium]|nr:DUF4349 domain-containing protein [Thermoanaerobaculia bacterium]